MEENADKVLIIDEDEDGNEILSQMVQKMGYISIVSKSVIEGVRNIENQLPDIVLMGLSMQIVDGFQFCEMLKMNPMTRNIPVIFLASGGGDYEKKKGFEAGAVDYIRKPFDYTEVCLRIQTHMKIYQMQKQLEEKNKRLSLVVSDHVEQIKTERKRFLKAMAKLAEENRFIELGNHMENVSYNARLLAEALNFTEEYDNKITNQFVDGIELAASIHDIGKIMIPKEILSKTSKLSHNEKEIVRTHTVHGYDMLFTAYEGVGDNDMIQTALEVVRSHHERWDGGGYPDQLKQEEIPLSARIVTIVDTYDCLMSERCYRSAYTREETIQIMKEESGKKFDPFILNVFFQVEKQMKKCHKYQFTNENEWSTAQ